VRGVGPPPDFASKNRSILRHFYIFRETAAIHPISTVIFAKLIIGRVAVVVNESQYNMDAVIWISVLARAPNQIGGMSSRPFKDYHYSRRELDDEMGKRIEADKNVLLIGGPLAG
jgi:hypothetical protein